MSIELETRLQPPVQLNTTLQVGTPGKDGAPGPKGDPGTGLVPKGTVASIADLPAIAQVGDMWLIGGDG